MARAMQADPPAPTAGAPSLPSTDDLKILMRTFASNSSEPEAVKTAQTFCETLFSFDYEIAKVDNTGGVLCPNYPPNLIVLVRDKHCADSRPVNSPDTLTRLFRTGKFARVRSRFAAPVILHGRTNVCRSGTLAKYLEMRTRELIASIFRGNEPDDLGERGDEAGTDRRRLCDIDLLKTLRVKYICDLMVEGRKLYCGMPVTSSEKVDRKARYRGFCIASTPYPGVEWFSSATAGDRLRWSEGSEVDAHFSVCENVLQAVPSRRVDWTDYRSWDLSRLTANYLHLFLDLVRLKRGTDDGLLIHCISGWDRTPLFVSLLRLVLWADGEIHQTLDASQILYLTIAYDWMLFGHLLSDRLAQGQEIFLFCFMFLKVFFDDAFASPDSLSPAALPPTAATATHTAGSSSQASPARRASGSLLRRSSSKLPSRRLVDTALHHVCDPLEPLRERERRSHDPAAIVSECGPAALPASLDVLDSKEITALCPVEENADATADGSAVAGPAMDGSTPLPAHSASAQDSSSASSPTPDGSGVVSNQSVPTSPIRPLTSADLLACTPQPSRQAAPAIRAAARSGPVLVGFAAAHHDSAPARSPATTTTTTTTTSTTSTNTTIAACGSIDAALGSVPDGFVQPTKNGAASHVHAFSPRSAITRLLLTQTPPPISTSSAEPSPASVGSTTTSDHDISVQDDTHAAAAEYQHSKSEGASRPIPIPRSRETRRDEAAGSWQLVTTSLSLNSLTDPRLFAKESPVSHTPPRHVASIEPASGPEAAVVLLATQPLFPPAPAEHSTVSVTVSSTAPATPDTRADPAAMLGSVSPWLDGSLRAPPADSCVNTSAASDANSSLCVVSQTGWGCSVSPTSPMHPSAPVSAFDSLDRSAASGPAPPSQAASPSITQLLEESVPAALPAGPTLSCSPGSMLARDLVAAACETDDGDSDVDENGLRHAQTTTIPPACVEAALSGPDGRRELHDEERESVLQEAQPHPQRGVRLRAVHELFLPLYRECLDAHATQQGAGLFARMRYFASAFKPSASASAVPPR